MKGIVSSGCAEGGEKQVLSHRGYAFNGMIVTVQLEEESDGSRKKRKIYTICNPVADALTDISDIQSSAV